jgi:formylglycine-generating enzyme required for sulfatase activity
MSAAIPYPISRQICSSLGVSALVLLSVSWPGCGRPNSEAPAEQVVTPEEAPPFRLVPITNMVLIRAGTFLRAGYPVTLTRDFWLGKYEVTQGEYADLMGSNPSHFQGDSNRPVEKVSLFNALAYCAALQKREISAGRLPEGFQYRLPTEAEWEYACRAGTTNLYYFGDSPEEAGQYAWTAENSEGTTQPVGQKLPNAWGLHDMHGNVWEWCQDWFAAFPKGEQNDPSGPSQGQFKVFRGGGWNQTVEFARVANRFMMSPSNGIYFVGFRVVLSQAGDPTAADQIP